MSKRILIVDDEEDICELFEFEFESCGFETHVAGNAKEAIEVLKENAVDAILSDVRMPGGNGLELLEWVRKNKPINLVFILMTGYSDVSLEKAFQQGAHGLFHKPLELPEVTSYAERCLAATGDSGPAQRRSERRPVSFEASVSLGPGQSYIVARVLDLSRGGVFLEISEEPPEVGTEISFRFTLPKEQQSVIEGTATCRWVLKTAERKGFGVEFQRLSVDSIEALFAYLTQLNILPLHPTQS